MASDLEIKAKEAYIDDHFGLAAELFTQAIEQNPESAELFAERAQVNNKLNYFTEAVADANRAIALDPSLSKAYLRKGTACFNLEEYQTAKAALETGAALAPGDQRFTNLIQQCDKRIAEEIDVIPNQSSEQTFPTNDATTDVDASADADVSADADASADAVASADAEPVDELANQVTVATAKPKYRHEFYQKPEEVVVTIFAKGIPANNVSVDFGEQILSVTIDVPGEDAYIFQPRLFGKIVTSKCKYDVLSTKIEIRLAKVEPMQWASLEFSKEMTVPLKSNTLAIGAPRPSYPSSKSKRTDWDKLEAEVKKEEKDEKLDGDAALNKFFRDIYADADEDTRRAMRKSFVESNGTVLSTNWKEVGSKKVEGSPPDGMEMKKWEY